MSPEGRLPQAAHACDRPKIPAGQLVAQPFCEEFGGKCSHQSPSPAWGHCSALAVLQGGLRPAPRCGQSVLAAALPLPAGQMGRQAVLGGSGHVCREAAVNGNLLLENKHNIITGACFSNRNALTWKSLGAQGQCMLRG